MKGRLIPLFTIALVIDFSSPKATSLLKQPLGPSGEVAVYPFRAKDPEKGASTCQHPLEKFVRSNELSAWADHLEHDSSEELPLAQTLHKIAFDARFGLHSIDQVIVDVPIHGTRDNCGGDVCAAIADLDRALQRKRGRMRIQTLMPLSCRVPAGSRVVLEDSSMLSTARVAKRAATLESSLKASKNDRTQNIASKNDPKLKADSDLFGTIQLQGAPIRIQLRWAGSGQVTTETLEPPGTAHLRAGSWSVSVLSPSWLTALPGWSLEVKSGETISVDLDQALGAQVSWVQSSPGADLVVELDTAKPSEFPARILIPHGSKPLPMPKELAYKVYQVQ